MTAFVRKPFEVPLTVDLIRCLRRSAGSYSDAIALVRTHLASSDRPGAAALAQKLSGVAANLALQEAHRAAQ